jgi:hypothetical protein
VTADAIRDIIAQSIKSAGSCLAETHNHINLILLALSEEWDGQEQTLTVINRDLDTNK